MDKFLTLLITGTLTGLLYALIALGFVVIYRASKVFNLAQGEFVVFGGFIVWVTTLNMGLPLYFGLPVAFVLTVLSGYVVERLFFSRLVGESIFAMVMMTIALLILLRGFMLVAFGAQVRPFPAILPTKAYFVDGVLIIGPLLYGAMLTVVLVAGLAWFFNHTRTGLMMTAVAEDHQIAMSLGISVKRSVAFAWILGMVISTVGAIVYLNGKSLNFQASEIGFAALPVALLAGLESIGGLLIAGAIIGIAEKLTNSYIDPLVGASVSSVLPYLIMLLILFVRPTGIFGWKTIERV